MIGATLITAMSIASMNLKVIETSSIINRRYQVNLKRQISKHGLDMIKRFECVAGIPVLEAYICPAGVLTIGFGHTGKDVVKGMKITPDRAEQLLINDTQRFVDNINKVVKVDIKQNQFDSLVSLAFNIGNANFNSSTLLKKINAEAPLNEIYYEFTRWNKGGGKVLAGLVARRKKEADNYVR